MRHIFVNISEVDTAACVAYPGSLLHPCGVCGRRESECMFNIVRRLLYTVQEAQKSRGELAPHGGREAGPPSRPMEPHAFR